MDYLLSIAPALPELMLALSVLVLLIVGACMKTETAGVVIPVFTRYILLGALIVLMLVATNSYTGVAFMRGNGVPMFELNTFGVFVKASLLVFTVFALIGSTPYLARHKLLSFEYPVLHILAVLGMMIMLSARDLIVLYVGMEMMSFPLYILAAYARDKSKSSEAGLKYFVLGSLASCLMIYGMSLFYGLAGDTSYVALAGVVDQFSSLEQPSLMLSLALVFTLTGLVFKISAVPFHMWTPDVYEGAPSTVTAFMAVLPKVAAIALLMSLLNGPLVGAFEQWQIMFIGLAILTMVVGSLAATVQNNLKRMLAYSSIANVGFMLVGLATGTTNGMEAVLVYLVIYGVMTFGIFAIINGLHKRGGKNVATFDDISGLGYTHPKLAICLMLLVFSLAGVPPLAGFFAKFFVFTAAVQAGLIPLAVIGVLASVIAAYYCLRVVKAMYFEEAKVEVIAPTFGVTALVYILTALVLFYFVDVDSLLNLANNAAIALVL
ncbi:MAG: NADH-quinone oxidoreductase subunit N [Pseudomonadota bacterium]|nr:NADH-quinone oxidoreductase subunit N [Pseudomonadota bacterium]